MKKFTLSNALASLFLATASLEATTPYVVSVGGDTISGVNGILGDTNSLRWILNKINTSGQDDYVVTFSLGSPTIQLVDMLPLLNLTQLNNLVINGSNSGNQIVIDGNNATRGFFAYQGNIELENLTIQNTLAQGGAGGQGFDKCCGLDGPSGCGGGMGAGSALYVYQAGVNLCNVTMNNNNVVGGAGGSYNGSIIASASGGGGMGGNGGSDGGGGGGLGGNGGSGALNAGGGGGIGPGGSGGSSPFVNGSNGGAIGAARAGGGSGGMAGGLNGGGGGAGGGGGGAGGGGVAGFSGGGTSGGMGGFGGGGGCAGGGDCGGGTPGDGGYGGGGGGADTVPGSSGGFGGGGSSGGFNPGGNGGFGGGGGGGSSPGNAGGLGGPGGGAGGGSSISAPSPTPSNGGGGGAGLGGAIFVDATSGGSLQVTCPLTVTGGSATAGAGGTAKTGGVNGTNGAGAASGIFVATGSTTGVNLTFAPPANSNVLIAGAIGDDSLTTLPTGQSYTPGSGVGAGLVMQGAGTLTLGGTNTYAGLTHVSAGTLVLNGSVASPILVDVGAILKGIGIGKASAIINGVLSPGNSIGPIHFNSLTLNSTSVFNVEINPTTNSQAQVTTTAQLNGGAVQVSPDPGTYTVGQQYIILVANAVNGTFSPTVLAPAGWSFSLAYQPMDVILTLLNFPATQINTQGLFGNNLRTADYLNTVDFSGNTAFADLVALSGDPLAEALSTISPSRNSFTTFVQQQNMFTLSNLVSARLSDQRYLQLICCQDTCCSPCEQYSNVWLTGFGDWSQLDAQNQNPEFNVNTGGAILGFDFYKRDIGTFGAGVAYATSSIHQDNHYGHNDIEGVYPTLYSSLYYCDFFLDMAIWGGYSRVHNHRNIFYPGFAAKAKSSYNSWAFNPHVEIGYDFCTGCVTFEPFVSVDWVNTYNQSYNENGADPYDMRVFKHHSSMLQSEAGLNFYWNQQVACTDLILRGGLSYINRNPYSTGTVNASIVGAPGSFKTVSFTSTQNLFSPSLEINWTAFQNGYVSLMYDGEFGSNYTANEVIIRAGYSF